MVLITPGVTWAQSILTKLQIAWPYPYRLQVWYYYLCNSIYSIYFISPHLQCFNKEDYWTFFETLDLNHTCKQKFIVIKVICIQLNPILKTFQIMCSVIINSVCSHCSEFHQKQIWSNLFLLSPLNKLQEIQDYCILLRSLQFLSGYV